MNRVQRLTILLLTACLGAGCASLRTSEFALVSAEAVPANIRIVKEDVYAESCADAVNMRGTYKEAVRMALAQAPGANVLVNASLSMSEAFAKYCMQVRGDAGVL
jgi:hypothetical protein